MFSKQILSQNNFLKLANRHGSSFDSVAYEAYSAQNLHQNNLFCSRSFHIVFLSFFFAIQHLCHHRSLPAIQQTAVIKMKSNE